MADPPVPPPMAMYAAAFTLALDRTATDDERAAARRLIADLGGELSSVRELPESRIYRRPHRVGLQCPRRDSFKALIREVVNERLS